MNMIYLDNHATTPVDPVVLDSMLPYFKEHFGNPASKAHPFGWIAEEAVGDARERIAKCFNISGEEVYFTSGATESNNLAIRGLAEKASSSRNHIITMPVEHSSVLKPVKYLGANGFTVSYLNVSKDGLIDLNELEDKLSGRTLLVAIQSANNEIGTLYPVKQIAELCHKYGAVFHTDAAQAIGKTDYSPGDIDADIITFSAHKLYGPKGIGGIIIRKRRPVLRIQPQMLGGGQERDMRSGTLNVPGITGMAKCIEIAYEGLEEEYKRIRDLRDLMLEILTSGLDNMCVNGTMTSRLPNNLNVSFRNTDINLLMSSLRSIAVSTGSACASNKGVSSHVLEAIGLEEELRKCSLRIGIGRFNTEEEIKRASSVIIDAVKSIKK